ncbi:Mitogen-activated protein kinase kinase kinase kinase 1 [Frankliniella fusca]|uniref:Mitogen-activated protein kinase kinase kinase kinase 1 n=1 Tax=Frankliniella fusca TaxID=407009 RepID=A0AAE1GT07_9NEOP|nr:Mitogen-activated protein kinase kinase kinase kinase 1 [Frankliniella fusca]
MATKRSRELVKRALEEKEKTANQQRCTSAFLVPKKKPALSAPPTIAMNNDEKCETWLRSNCDFPANDISEVLEPMNSTRRKKISPSEDLFGLQPVPAVLHDVHHNHNVSSEQVFNTLDNMTSLTADISVVQPISVKSPAVGYTVVDMANSSLSTFANQDDCFQETLLNSEAIMITPQESGIEPQNNYLPISTFNTDGTSLTVLSAIPDSSAVKRNLFPPDPKENQELDVKNLSDDDFHSSFLPLEEPENTEDVIPPSVAQITNETIYVAPEPDTEGEDIISNNKRRRPCIPTDKAPSRKKKVIPENWKRTKAKVAYNAGLPHVSKTGKVKKARGVRPPCPETCRQKCFSRQRKTSQWLFVAKLARVVDIKQRTVIHDQDDEPYRKHSYEYFLKDAEENLIQVCKTMCINTFDISIKAVKTALLKNSPDKRGKHSNRKKLPHELQESVKQHIKKFPLKDQCSLCIASDAPYAEKTEEQINEYNQHQHEKKKVRKLKKEDKELSRETETSNIRVVTFDLQKILYCPKGENAEFYYKRKLSSLNFTLMDCTVKRAYCYVWDLTVGKKGADEVASFVFDYIKAMVEKGVKDFRFYMKKPAYIVKEAGKDVPILTFRELCKPFTWSKVPIATLRRLTVDSNEPSNIFYQTECDGMVTKHSILIKKAGRPINWATIKLDKAYSGKLPLKPKVVTDLKWYVEKGFIPEAHPDFYRYVTEDEAGDNSVELNESEEEDDVPQEIAPRAANHTGNNSDEDGTVGVPIIRDNVGRVESYGDITDDDDFDDN